MGGLEALRQPPRNGKRTYTRILQPSIRRDHSSRDLRRESGKSTQQSRQRRRKPYRRQGCLCSTSSLVPATADSNSTTHIPTAAYLQVAKNTPNSLHHR